jgi:hypothetical protein
VATGQLSVAILPVEPSKLDGMNSMHFWVQSDHDSTLIVSLQKKGEGRFTSMFQAKKGQWQSVDLSLSDFTLSTDADSPKDPDGKLEPEKIESIAITDFAEFIVQNKKMGDLLGISNGPRTIFISDFSTSRDRIPDTFTMSPDNYRVDTYARPALSWAGIGLQSFDIATDSPFPGKWMKLVYKSDPLHLSGAVHSTVAGAVAGKKTVHFQMAANAPTKVTVQIEQTDGGKYNTVLDIPGMAKLTDENISLDSLTRAQDSTDPDTKPHLGLVKQILILDISGVAGGPEQDNTLWVGPIDFRG